MFGAVAQTEQAARLFGAEQALRESINAAPVPGIRADHEHTLSEVRAQMGEAAFAAAWAEGQAMSLEKTVAYALEGLSDFQQAPLDGDSSVPVVEMLTEREQEILQLIADGLSNQEIAETLIVALGTVAKHTHNIFEKLGVRNRTQALTRARELHLL